MPASTHTETGAKSEGKPTEQPRKNSNKKEVEASKEAAKQGAEKEKEAEKKKESEGKKEEKSEAGSGSLPKPTVNEVKILGNDSVWKRVEVLSGYAHTLTQHSVPWRLHTSAQIFDMF